MFCGQPWSFARINHHSSHVRSNALEFSMPSLYGWLSCPFIFAAFENMFRCSIFEKVDSIFLSQKSKLERLSNYGVPFFYFQLRKTVSELIWADMYDKHLQGSNSLMLLTLANTQLVSTFFWSSLLSSFWIQLRLQRSWKAHYRSSKWRVDLALQTF